MERRCFWTTHHRQHDRVVQITVPFGKGGPPSLPLTGAPRLQVNITPSYKEHITKMTPTSKMFVLKGEDSETLFCLLVSHADLSTFVIRVKTRAEGMALSFICSKSGSNKIEWHIAEIQDHPAQKSTPSRSPLLLD